jgi:hypothetical protein
MMVSLIDENKKERNTSTMFFWLTEAHREYINMIASPHLFITKKENTVQEEIFMDTICL